MIGIKDWEFWHMTMRTFNAYYEAYNRNRKIADSDMWTLGIYIRSAIASCLSSKNEYVKYPFSQKAEMEEKDLQKQREAFVAGLMAMKTNFELAQMDNTESNNSEGKE